MENLIKKVLKNENLSYKQITKSNSGFNNLVYFVDDKFVIKLSQNLLKEINFYKNIKLSYIPKYIASGKLNNYQYLIISKLKGKTLYSVWHKLSENERNNCIKQIAKILKDFHKQDISNFDENIKILNWIDYFSTELKLISKTLANLHFDTQFIDEFILNKMPIIFTNNYFGLVYNDAHFDNFIYDNGKLKLIDFDRILICPIDYEMMIFKTMCDNPTKFANEEDELFIKKEDYSQIFNQLKNEYKDLFLIDNFEKRIAVYQFHYQIKQAIKNQNNDKINHLLIIFKKQIK